MDCRWEFTGLFYSFFYSLSLSVINSSLDECQARHDLMGKDSLAARFWSFQPLLHRVFRHKFCLWHIFNMGCWQAHSSVVHILAMHSRWHSCIFLTCSSKIWDSKMLLFFIEKYIFSDLNKLYTQSRQYFSF